jgi:hypothetical protein
VRLGEFGTDRCLVTMYANFDSQTQSCQLIVGSVIKQVAAPVFTTISIIRGSTCRNTTVSGTNIACDVAPNSGFYQLGKSYTASITFNNTISGIYDYTLPPLRAPNVTSVTFTDCHTVVILGTSDDISLYGSYSIMADSSMNCSVSSSNWSNDSFRMTAVCPNLIKNKIDFTLGQYNSSASLPNGEYFSECLIVINLNFRRSMCAPSHSLCFESKSEISIKISEIKKI